ncbi:MAG: ribonuclease J [Oligoflexia bacterium]|nr:ribonuclease J [Oligoflexia bacterium]
MSTPIKIMPLGGVGEIGHNMMVIKTPSECIIVDAGIMFPHDQVYNLQYLIPNISQLDVNLTTSLLITHAHEDHIGAVPYLKKKIPHLKIYASPFAREIIKIKLAQKMLETDKLDLSLDLSKDSNKNEEQSLLQDENQIYQDDAQDAIETQESPSPSPSLSPSLQPFLGTYYSDSDLILIEDNSHFSFKEIDIYPIRVNHSIPETYGFLIQDKKKCYSLFYASDCKVDNIKNENGTITEHDFDFKRLQELSKNSQRKFLFLDSTDVMFEGKALSEKDLIAPIEDIIITENNKDERERGRIFITFFPSNIYRLQTIIDLALKHNRKIVFYGRSLKQYAAKAQSCGYLQDLNRVLVDEDELKSMRSSEAIKRLELIVLLTGCQGDLKGALNRVVSGQDPLFKIYPGDLLLFSSRTIPGNEKRLTKIYNKIYEQGGRIITAKEKRIHASGHGGAIDNKNIIDLYNPSDLIPIHGETYYLYKHIEFINKNYPQIKTHLLLNSDELTLDSDNIDTLLIEKGTPLPPLFMLDNGIAIEKTSINTRRKMSSNGVVFVTLLVSNPGIDIDINLDLENRVELSVLGFPLFINEYLPLLKERLIQISQSNPPPNKEILKSVLKKFFKKFFETAPVMEIHIVTLA